MAQNIYDNQAFFDGYATLPRSQHGHNGAPEWLAIREMLPALTGKTVLDLGCGYGWFCRSAREMGAAAVTGIDLSEKMLARAREMTNDPQITYKRGDLASLTLAPASMDFIYSSLTLHYLPDLNAFFRTVFIGLKPKSYFVFSIEHPIFTCPTKQGWLMDTEGNRFWGVNQYQKEGQRVSDWFTEGVIKYHRTLGSVLNALIMAGFSLSKVNEWGPSAKQIAALPALAEEAERPMLVLIAAQKP